MELLLKSKKKCKKDKDKTLKTFVIKRDYKDYFIPINLPNKGFYKNKKQGKLKIKRKNMVLVSKNKSSIKLVSSNHIKEIVLNKDCGYKFIIRGINLYFSLDKKYRKIDELEIDEVKVMRGQKIDESLYHVSRKINKKNKKNKKNRRKPPAYGFCIKKYSEVICKCIFIAECRGAPTGTST